MAFDTKYRPRVYDDVLGQDEYIAVCREFVRSGTGFHQSYLFCGQHGSGKTTTARILARALLCENSTTGDPCDKCNSCLSILEHGYSEGFVEFDAATNSGKDDIKRIIEELQYSTFSGSKRLYLFDEAHQLSKQALDALLKPMEDEVPGSEDKQLVCIFCTTEPEKMRATIFSRCAPSFTIRSCKSEQIAKRLAFVCEQEGIEHDDESLVLLAEFNESHIRDALKALEGVSKLGAITRENCNKYLRLDSNVLCADLLLDMGVNQVAMMEKAVALYDLISPAVAYKRLAEIAMLAYRTGLGVGKAPLFWEAATLAQINEQHGAFLLALSEHLSSRPAKPTTAMLLCDLAHLHHKKMGTLPVFQQAVLQAPTPVAAPVTAPVAEAPPPQVETPPATPVSTTPPAVGKVSLDPIGDPPTPTDNDPDQQHSEAGPTHDAPRAQVADDGSLLPMDLNFFRAVLRRRVEELGVRGGSKGRTHMGSA